MVARSTPATKFGRALTPPPRMLFGLLCWTFNGKPDCHVVTDAIVQPPMTASAMPLLLANF